jgi:hypothetical protein
LVGIERIESLEASDEAVVADPDAAAGAAPPEAET